MRSLAVKHLRSVIQGSRTTVKNSIYKELGATPRLLADPVHSVAGKSGGNNREDQRRFDLQPRGKVAGRERQTQELPHASSIRNNPHSHDTANSECGLDYVNPRKRATNRS